jgi:putative ABC transport system permease protein
MNYFKIRLFLKELYRAIIFYKIRFFFSVISVSLGVGAVALIVASIDGANKKAYEIFDVFGPDSVLVIGGGRTEGPASRSKTLTIDDAIAIKENIPAVFEVTPRVLFSPVTVVSGKSSWSTTVIGTTADYFTSLKAGIKSGRSFSPIEVKNKSAVAVIGSKVAEKLYEGAKEGINDNMTFTIGLLPVHVIGIMQKRDTAGISEDLNDRIIMPITTVSKRLLNDEKYVANLWFKTKGDIDSAIKSVKTLLRINHKTPEALPDDFRIVTSKEILKQMKLLSNNLILFLGGAGIIALIVGGFIVANLTYLSIRQRQKDIGIKSAFGATKKDIVAFFLTEEVLITFIGGLLGILWTIFGGLFLHYAGDIAIYISYKVLLTAIILSFLVGFLSGIKPALVVSRIDPIRVIRG